MDGAVRQTRKRFRCPYCHKTFLSVAGAQGHWATKHTHHGKRKPVYDIKKVVKRTVGKKVQLKNAQQKAAKNVKKRIHRSVEDCEKEIAAYEEALEEMTAEENKKKTGISKQRVHRMRMKVKEARDK